MSCSARRKPARGCQQYGRIVLVLVLAMWMCLVLPCAAQTAGVPGDGNSTNVTTQPPPVSTSPTPTTPTPTTIVPQTTTPPPATTPPQTTPPATTKPATTATPSSAPATTKPATTTTPVTTKPPASSQPATVAPADASESETTEPPTEPPMTTQTLSESAARTSSSSSSAASALTKGSQGSKGSTTTALITAAVISTALVGAIFLFVQRRMKNRERYSDDESMPPLSCPRRGTSSSQFNGGYKRQSQPTPVTPQQHRPMQPQPQPQRSMPMQTQQLPAQMPSQMPPRIPVQVPRPMPTQMQMQMQMQMQRQQQAQASRQRGASTGSAHSAGRAKLEESTTSIDLNDPMIDILTPQSDIIVAQDSHHTVAPLDDNSLTNSEMFLDDSEVHREDSDICYMDSVSSLDDHSTTRSNNVWVETERGHGGNERRPDTLWSNAISEGADVDDDDDVDVDDDSNSAFLDSQHSDLSTWHADESGTSQFSAIGRNLLSSTVPRQYESETFSDFDDDANIVVGSAREDSYVDNTRGTADSMIRFDSEWSDTR